MRRWLLILGLPACLMTPVTAQENDAADMAPHGRSMKVFEAVKRRGGLPRGIDSTYIMKFSEPWTFKIRMNQSGSNIIARSETDGDRNRVDLSAQMKITFSVAATFHGLSAAVALNPWKLFGRYSDFEFNLNSYGNRAGFDVIYNRTASYTGIYTMNGVKTDIPKGIFKQRMLTFNAYYAFNNSHFSYPAAFSQRQLQRRSCGSLLAGTTLMYGELCRSEDETLGITDGKVLVRQWSAGAGYGYNWVMPHRWLLHFSAVPQLVLLAHDRSSTAESEQPLHLSFPNIVVNGRFAVVHHYRNRFFGLSAVVNNNNSGHGDWRVSNVKWRARLFYGFRL